MTLGTRIVEPTDGVRREPQDARSLTFDHLDAIAAVLDDLGVVVDTNEAWRLFADLNGGIPSRTGVGVNYLQVCDVAAAAGDEDAAQVASGLREVLSGTRSSFDLEYPCRSPTEGRWFLLQALAVPVALGRGALVFHRDITDRRQLESRLAEESYFDELTGLPNRISVLEFIDEQLALAGLYDAPVSAVCLAVEGLDEIRAESGQHLGDILLTKVASRLRQSIRGGDIVARISATEFLVVCPGQREAAAHATADRLSVVIGAPFQVGSRPFAVGVSAGAATTRGTGSATDLFEAAGAVSRRTDGDRDVDHVSPVGFGHMAARASHPSSGRARGNSFTSPRDARGCHSESEPFALDRRRVVPAPRTARSCGRARRHSRCSESTRTT